MKRIIIFTIVTVFAIAAGVGLNLSQAKPGPRNHPQFISGWDETCWEMQDGKFGAMKMLALSDEQEEKISKERIEHKKKMMQLKTEMVDHRTKLKLLLTAEQFSQKDADKIASKLGDLSESKTKLMSAHLRKVRDILNDEQRVHFDERILSARGLFEHQGKHDGGFHKPHGPKGVR